jgi:hypothetical protein
LECAGTKKRAAVAGSSSEMKQREQQGTADLRFGGEGIGLSADLDPATKSRMKVRLFLLDVVGK